MLFIYAHTRIPPRSPKEQTARPCQANVQPSFRATVWSVLRSALLSSAFAPSVFFDSATMNALRLASRVAPRAIGRVGLQSQIQSTAFRSTSVARFSSAEKAPELHELGSLDHGYETDRIDKVAEPERRAFTYLMLSGVRFAYASTARVLVVKFVSSMTASADVLALASAEFDLSEIPVGSTITVKWRGKPVFIRHRSQAEIDTENAVPMSHLRDQEADDERTINQEYLVALGICTHLGCVPISNAGEFGGWFCPCHGSHYDVSGRIRKGPAPLNLEVPPYKFTEEKKILIG